MLTHRKRWIVFASALLSLAALSGAGCVSSDTAGDTTQSEQNRQNGEADLLESQYAQLKGQFAGTYNASDVLLTLDVARQASTGSGEMSLVPPPTFVGNLELTPRIFVDDSGQPLTIPFSVTSGEYADGNDLTLDVLQNGASTILHCKVTDPDHLDCNWYLQASTAPRASFQLSRVQPGGQGQQGLASSQSRLDGTYHGQNADYSSISVEFRTFLEPQAGSLAIPQVSIVGSFVFVSRRTHASPNFPFKDGEYDPISNSIAISIPGSNPIEVDCGIRSGTSLHCSWIGTHGDTSYEDFDLAKSG